ncbi:hypothetical protein LXA43DRAFT_283169 [Ganoderma leucocontextum]|nr:hypothetical protein LXA43DRAFT_283169 [Ganoderma leucocontextum]
MPDPFHVFMLVLFTTASVARLSNRTIDDQFGDSATGAPPEYSSRWVQGAGCDGCAIRLDTAKLFRGTWHGIATSPNEDRTPTAITLQFTGVAIYVYNVLANSVPNADFATGTYLTFTLDGAPDGRFEHNPTDSTQFFFNQLVYAHADLANGKHVLVIQPDTAQESLCMFDFAEYTFSNESTVSSSSGLSTSSPPSHSPSSSLSTSYSLSSSSTFSPSVSSPTSRLNTSASTAPLCSAPCPTSQDNSMTEHSPWPSQLPAVQQTTPPLGAILGGSIGGAAAFLALLTALLLYMRIKRHPVWSRLPPNEGTTEAQQHRDFSSGDIRDDILHITSASRPFNAKANNHSRISSAQNSLPPAEHTGCGTEVIRDSHTFLYPDQPTSSHGLTASAAGRQAVASPHTSIDVVIDGQLRFSDTGRRIGQSARSDTVSRLRSASLTSMARSTERCANEEVLSQLASLRAEVAGLRAQQEVQWGVIEAPPRYGEGM